MKDADAGGAADEGKHNDGADDEGRKRPAEQGTHHRGGTPFAINPRFAEDWNVTNAAVEVNGDTKFRYRADTYICAHI